MKAGAVTHFIVSDVLQSVDESFLASFPGLPTVQFLLLSVCKNEGGRPGPFYHVNDVSVYLVGRRGWGGGMHYSQAFFVLNQEWYAFHFANIQNPSA